MFEIITETKIKDIQHLRDAFKKKKELENLIAKLIMDFEDETGLAIDMVRYQRDMTIPIKGPKYTDLTIIISPQKGN